MTPRPLGVTQRAILLATAGEWNDLRGVCAISEARGYGLLDADRLSGAAQRLRRLGLVEVRFVPGRLGSKVPCLQVRLTDAGEAAWLNVLMDHREARCAV